MLLSFVSFSSSPLPHFVLSKTLKGLGSLSLYTLAWFWSWILFLAEIPWSPLIPESWFVVEIAYHKKIFRFNLDGLGRVQKPPA